MWTTAAMMMRMKSLQAAITSLRTVVCISVRDVMARVNASLRSGLLDVTVQASVHTVKAVATQVLVVLPSNVQCAAEHALADFAKERASALTATELAIRHGIKSCTNKSPGLRE